MSKSPRAIDRQRAARQAAEDRKAAHFGRVARLFFNFDIGSTDEGSDYYRPGTEIVGRSTFKTNYHEMGD